MQLSHLIWSQHCEKLARVWLICRVQSMHSAGKPSKQRSKAIKKKLHVTVRKGCYCSKWPGGTQLELTTFNQIPACAFREKMTWSPCSPIERSSCSYKLLHIHMTVGKCIKKQKCSLCCEESSVENLNQLVLNPKEKQDLNLVFIKYHIEPYCPNILHFGKLQMTVGTVGLQFIFFWMWIFISQYPVIVRNRESIYWLVK